MEDFIKTKCEREGHIDFYEDRGKVWTFVKSERLSDICLAFKQEYEKLNDCYKSKRDGEVHKQIKWHQFLSGFSDNDTDAFCKDIIDDAKLHKCVLYRTIGKYFVVHQKQTKVHSKKILTKAKKTKKQSKCGIQVLSGGVLGQMFRGYKKKKRKGLGKKQEKLHNMLRQWTLVDKGSSVPVYQRALDKGGLYNVHHQTRVS